MSEHRPPPLTDAEKASRELRLQYNHERYVKSVSTMRSLPRLQSTIAGAGGKTNEQVRLAEERETERRQRMQSEADRARRKEENARAHQEKVDALEERQQKKRARAAKKKANKKMRKGAEGAAGESNDRGSCASEDEESVGEEVR